MEINEETEENESFGESEHFYDFKQTQLVRIEYPGNVQNIDKAIKSLGGLANVKEAVTTKKFPLELRFHPKNFYNKPCIADIDENVGFLLKVKKNIENAEEPYTYEVIGATTTNFEFNRMCDFQYLPLVDKKTENNETTAEYVHDKIFTDEVPSMEWFTKKETAQTSVFSLPSIFSKYDTPHPQAGLKSGDVFSSIVRPDSTYNWDRKHQPANKKIEIFYNHQVNFLKVDLIKIPQDPYPEALQKVKDSKYLQAYYDTVARLFDDRPIWSRQGLMHMAKLKSVQLKSTVPAIAYYCTSGPWKRCWIRLGYNPTKDPNSRIYQVMDFRIRRDGSQPVMIKLKREHMTKSRTSYINPDLCLGERGYLLKPGFLPPARQMCYQYCDILLPEVQEMITKLPKLPQTAQYDLKNGWLPLSFTEHCREIVSAYIKSTIHEEFIKEAQQKRLDQLMPGTSRASEHEDEEGENIGTQSSRMLSNISRGVYQRPKFDPTALKGSKSVIELDDSTLGEAPIDIDLEEEDDDDIENLSDDSYSDSDVGIIDLEAVEEINELIGNM